MEKILDEKIVIPHPEDDRDRHRQASALSDIILGGQDGLVNVLGVILGVAAATNDPHIVLVAGLAATFAESVSMGAVAYTSTMADADFYESEQNARIPPHPPDAIIWNVTKYVLFITKRGSGTTCWKVSSIRSQPTRISGWQ